MHYKYGLIAIIAILTALPGCKLTGSGDINDAELYIQNLTGNTIYLTIEDGSLGPYPQIELAPRQAYSRTWESGDEVFTINNGMVMLHYFDNSSLTNRRRNATRRGNSLACPKGQFGGTVLARSAVAGGVERQFRSLFAAATESGRG